MSIRAAGLGFVILALLVGSIESGRADQSHWVNGGPFRSLVPREIHYPESGTQVKIKSRGNIEGTVVKALSGDRVLVSYRDGSLNFTSVIFDEKDLTPIRKPRAFTYVGTEVFLRNGIRGRIVRDLMDGRMQVRFRDGEVLFEGVPYEGNELISVNWNSDEVLPQEVQIPQVGALATLPTGETGTIVENFKPNSLKVVVEYQDAAGEKQKQTLLSNELTPVDNVRAFSYVGVKVILGDGSLGRIEEVIGNGSMVRVTRVGHSNSARGFSVHLSTLKSARKRNAVCSLFLEKEKARSQSQVPVSSAQ